ncbi:DNA-binding transcriptional regulator, AcrR family [Actinokineospora alba]|uniref:DNA-binding transcriptional regulator, AcrR family n=1 Tax=Actinokineospora alba TaxID=504798 RepID=A0A1H0JM25_9PSEU|nr:TetR/AcrR family transcriptional regulator [Actinokineospora alba]TDP68251.1 TetR family transcriptional regulator [Actinokineospora alba]SDH95193.1 DNA-binding transcriptional regulator, AcrR family [Actinokineospora alba]SDO44431.1 DNA-binding transcriptional regulator, AcrR family [Actinokineospora alba]
MSGQQRRSQQERRETTIGLLIDATIDTISEVGYAQTSLGAVCERSGVSKGGLFRHFDSRLDLVVAAAEEVARRHTQSVRARFAELRAPTIADAMRVMRERHRAVDNVVWFELLVAARTDPALRSRLSATWQWFFAEIQQIARTVRGTEVFSDADLELLVNTLEHTFDGETIRREIAPDPVVEDRRLELLVEFAEFLAARAGR